MLERSYYPENKVEMTENLIAPPFPVDTRLLEL
jgi:hypothetical protein